MKVFAFSFYVGLLIFVPSLARADWQYTTWGMSPDEVVKASGAAAVPATNPGSIKDESTELLRASYTAGEYNFDAGFYFSIARHNLVLVQLRMRDLSQCSSLWGDLKSRYGQPQAQGKIAGIIEYATWRDIENGNFVSVHQSGNDPRWSCALSYKKLLGEKSGL